MAKKKVVKKQNKKTANKCLLVYVFNSSPNAIFFNSEKEMKDFIDNFEVDKDRGDWLDFCITGITGKTKSLDPDYDMFSEG